MAYKRQQVTDTEDIRHETINGCLANICLSENLADIHFTFPKEEDFTVPAHKTILALRSPVFNAMFYGTFPQQEGGVKILDITSNIFLFFLRYMYTDSLDLTGKNIGQILYCATKYQLKSLVLKCEHFLLEHLAAENSCTIYNLTKTYSLESLKIHVKDFIANNACSVLKSKGFCSLSSDDVTDLLKIDSLRITEIEIFKAILKWADAQLTQSKLNTSGRDRRSVLSCSGILYLVALPMISLEDYTNTVVPSNVLTDEEQLYLFKAITMTGSISSTTNKFRMKARYTPKTVTVNVQHILQEQLCNSLPDYGGYPNSLPDYDGPQTYNGYGVLRKQKLSMTKRNVHEYAENITMRSTKRFTLVSIDISPKFRRIKHSMGRIEMVCTVRGKTFEFTYRHKTNCKVEINQDFPPNDTWNLVLEVKPEFQGNNMDEYCYDFPNSKCKQYEFQTVQAKPVPNSKTSRRDILNHDTTSRQTSIDFSFEGADLVESFEIIEFD